MEHQKAKILILLATLIPEAILDSSLSPLLPFIVKHFFPKTTEIGYYVGILASSFYFPLFLMNIVWGYLSDRPSFGRKYVMILGLMFGLITTLALGFSTSFVAAVFCRVLAGCFGANSTIAKSFIGDLARDQRSRAWAYSMYGSVYGISGIVGPLLAGVLASPADLYPSLFSKTGIFGRFPYLLITSFVFLLMCIATYLAMFHLPDKPKYELISEEEFEESFDAEGRPSLALSTTGSANPPLMTRESQLALRRGPASPPPTPVEPDTPTPAQPHLNTRTTFSPFAWTTIAPIFLYCCIAYTHMSYTTSIPLFFSSTKLEGGLNLESQTISFSLSLLAVSKLVSQLFLFDSVLSWTQSSKRLYMYAMIAYVPIHFFVPMLAAVDGPLKIGLVLVVMVTLGMCECFGYLSVILLITESHVPENLGKAHGLASTMRYIYSTNHSAFARTVSPAMTGSIWEWSSGWRALVFLVGAGVGSVGAFASIFV